MRRVITYGTFDMLHRGHVRLLERARALGDYLIVGVTSDDFDRARGKVNVSQPLPERMEAVRATGLADEVVVEEYEGQKIDDVRRYGVDVFAIGSDWRGRFDYLREWCEVVYLDRTEGISSTRVRSESGRLRLAVVGGGAAAAKYAAQAARVDGLELAGCLPLGAEAPAGVPILPSLGEALSSADAVALLSEPSGRPLLAAEALRAGVHVLCEPPVALSEGEYDSLRSLADGRGLVLFEGLKTAHSTAYNRLVLMVRGGEVGDVVSVDATCTSLRPGELSGAGAWGSFEEWGPVALLPVLQILGTDWRSRRFASAAAPGGRDAFTRLELAYPSAVASVTVAKGAKSEGNLVVSGTEGYVWVPAPWWKTDYFEIRREDPNENRRFFWQLEGEGILEELVSFKRACLGGYSAGGVDPRVSRAVAGLVGDFQSGRGVFPLSGAGSLEDESK